MNLFATVQCLRTHTRSSCLIVASLLLACTGCFELETTVAMRRDGGATITERVRFSQQLLDFDVEGESGIRVVDLLTREAVLERMKQMGEGIRLKSHEVRDAEGASKEAVTVYEIDDIAKLQYASPLAAYLDYADNNIVKFVMEPVYQGSSTRGRRAGDVAVWVEPLKRPQRDNPPQEGEPEPKPPTPQELQSLREIQPIFRDMMKGLSIKLRFESYAPLRHVGFGHRGRRSGANHCELIDVSADDFDKYGVKFLENEEIMLELLRGDVGGKNIIEHVVGFVNNHTVPVFLGAGSRHNRVYREEIHFPPSRTLFDRHYKGKMLTFVYEKGPGRTRPASFEEIGEREEK